MNANDRIADVYRWTQRAALNPAYAELFRRCAREQLLRMSQWHADNAARELAMDAELLTATTNGKPLSIENPDPSRMAMHCRYTRENGALRFLRAWVKNPPKPVHPWGDAHPSAEIARLLLAHDCAALLTPERFRPRLIVVDPWFDSAFANARIPGRHYDDSAVTHYRVLWNSSRNGFLDHPDNFLADALERAKWQAEEMTGGTKAPPSDSTAAHHPAPSLPIAKRVERCWGLWLRAVDGNPGITLTDDAAHNWLAENWYAKDDGQLPARETFKRYVGEYRRLTQQGKNSRRAGRDGRSLVSVARL